MFRFERGLKPLPNQFKLNIIISIQQRTINFYLTVTRCIGHGVRFANAGIQPYIEAQYVNIGFLLIINTGSIPDACREWQRRTPVNQTSADFRLEFERVQQEQRIISSTSSGTGYHTSNVAEQYVQNPLPADGRFVTAIANLATATSADRETVATLTKAIETLTEQLKANNIWAKFQEAELKLLLDGRDTTAPSVPTTLGANKVRKSYKTKNDNYCWSHGYQAGLAHTGVKFTKKAPLHKDAATKDNIMGGDTWGSEFL
jgi:hypothetical protein